MLAELEMYIGVAEVGIGAWEETMMEVVDDKVEEDTGLAAYFITGIIGDLRGRGL